MKTRKLTSTFVFIDNKLEKNIYLEIDSNGKILNINKYHEEIQDLEYFGGILIPGMINCHCHLELSNLKGLMSPSKHLIDFLCNIANAPKSTLDPTKTAKIWDEKMFKEGISAVGDISNTALTAKVKQESKIYYHTFIELLGTNQERILRDDVQYNNVSKSFLENNHKNFSATAHAPYSVCPELFDAINNYNKVKKIYSIHNQESQDENLLYQSHSGEIYKRFAQFGFDMDNIPLTGKNSLESYAPKLKDYQNVLLVHNTFSHQEDFSKAKEILKNPFFVLCPKSNLMLEHSLPNLKLMLENNLDICIGTDSLSSNDNLSILEELKVLQDNFDVNLETLLKIATYNGAKALDILENFGELKISKNPGIVLLENIDLKNKKITKSSTSKRII